MTSLSVLQNTVASQNPGIANFTDIIETVISLNKANL